MSNAHPMIKFFPVMPLPLATSPSATLQTLVDKANKEWTVQLRQENGSLYTLSRGEWRQPMYPSSKEWDLAVGIPMKSAQERILRLWKATHAGSRVHIEVQKSCLP